VGIQELESDNNSRISAPGRKSDHGGSSSISGSACERDMGVDDSSRSGMVGGPA
jgi:hypothetical protein